MVKVNILKIANWNANGIVNKMNELEEFLYRHRIDVCFVTEARLSNKSKQIKFTNYNCYRKDRTGSNTGGGVIILVNKKYNSTEKIIDDNNTNGIVNIETIAITLFDITFVAAYMPPQKTLITEDIKKIMSLSNSVIIGGDINAKHQSWGNNRLNKSGKKLLNFIINDKTNSNYCQVHHPDEPTYYSTNSRNASTLDIFISKNVNLNKPITANEMSSDHLPVITIVKPHFNGSNNNSNIYKLDYSKTDWNKYRSLLNSNWAIIKDFKSNNDLDDTINMLNNSMKISLDSATPKWENANIGKGINLKIKALIKKRNATRKIAQKNNCPNCKKETNILNNRIKYELQKHRNNQYEKFLKSLEIRNGSIWNAIKMHKLKNGTKNKKINKIHGPNGIVYNNIDKANVFANYFESVYSLTEDYGYNKHNNTINKSYERIINNNTSNDNNDFNRIYSNDIRAVIKTLKNKKAPGIDGVSNLQIKNCPNKLIAQLVYIYNYCLQNDYFPNIWKTAKMLPLPKPGKDSLFPQNYRPISLLNAFSKIFEKIIAKNILKFLNSNKVLNEAQFGFRPGLCTVRQLARVVYIIISNINKNKHSGMVLMDIEKAFDTVSHKALIYKLHKIKINAKTIKLINSYLTNRQFIVNVNGHNSVTKDITAGVPQGSVLGPLLFIIYINDIPNHDNVNMALFADDTAIIANSGNYKLLIDKLEKHSREINKFFYKWKIKINIDKTELLITTHNKKSANTTMTFNEQAIKNKDCVKYLGLYIDANLNFTTHINHTVTKAKVAIGLIYNLLRNKYIKIELKILIYKMCIRPILTYACPVWCNTSNKNIKKLQVIQNKCLNIILCNFRSNANFYKIDECHTKANIEYIEKSIEKLSRNFYSNLTSNVKNVKNFGENSINTVWDKKRWPHQKYFANN